MCASTRNLAGLSGLSTARGERRTPGAASAHHAGMTFSDLPAVLTRREINELGIPRGELRGLVRSARWHRISGGYATRPPATWGPADRWRAALMAVGGRAALSHTTAAAAFGWDLLTDDPRLHVTVARNRSGAQAPRVVVHRRMLGPGDVCELGPLTITSPVRTVLDLAALLPFTDAVVVADAALRQRSVEPGELYAGLAASRRWPDHPRMRSVILACDARAGSVPETMARLAFAEAELPTPVTQLEARDFNGRLIAIADFGWPDHRVLVEIDGMAYHSNGVDFKRDRVRQNALVLAGWTILRFTARQVFEEPKFMVEQVCEALAAA